MSKANPQQQVAGGKPNSFDQVVEALRQPREKTKVVGHVTPRAYEPFQRTRRHLARRDARDKGISFQEAYQKISQSEVLEVVLLAADAVVPPDESDSEESQRIAADTDPDQLTLGDATTKQAKAKNQNTGTES